MKNALLLLALILIPQLSVAEVNSEGFFWAEKDAQFVKSSDLSPTDIKVLWWNIQKGETNDLMAKKFGHRALDQNLRALVSSEYSPDVLVLGEYADGILEPETELLLRKKLPYSPAKFWSTNSNWTDRGIMVFSRFPFEETRREIMDFYAPETGNADQIKAYRSYWGEGFPQIASWPRWYLLLRFTAGSQTFYLSPVHLLQQWERMFRDLGGSWVAKMIVKARVALANDNPLRNQLGWFRGYLERDFGLDLDQAPLVVVGDFNMPASVWHIPTPYYTYFSRGLVDAFEGAHTPSWPAKYSHEEQLLGDEKHQIDQAFLSKQLKGTSRQVLPLAGSDHYPLFFSIRPN